MTAQQFTVSTDQDMENIFALIRESVAAFGSISVDISKVEKTRTQTQNNCLQLWCKQLAQALNDAGYDMVILMQKLSKKTEIPWTGTSVKEKLWRPVQIAMTDNESTTKPSTVEYQLIYETLNRVIANNAPGVHVPWPTRFNQ